MRAERLQADLSLLLAALIWGTAFVAQRQVANAIGVFQYNGLRFLVGGLVLLPLAFRRKLAWQAERAFSRENLVGVLGVGSLLFAGSWLQQLGLRTTSAGNAGFITGLYVVLIPIILAVVWRQQPPLSIWLAALLSTLGLFMLSTGGRLSLNPGDGYELAGACIWALHVILISRLVQRMDVLPLAIGQYFVCGLLHMGFSLAVEPWAPAAVASAAWSILYVGVFSVALGYTLQARGQRHAPPADAAILLSMEAVFAAVFGWLWLAEYLAPVQMAGGVLIFAGMLLAQAPALRGAGKTSQTQPIEEQKDAT